MREAPRCGSRQSGAVLLGRLLTNCDAATSGKINSGVVLRENHRLSEHGRHDMKVRTCRLSKRSLKG